MSGYLVRKELKQAENGGPPHAHQLKQTNPLQNHKMSFWVTS